MSFNPHLPLIKLICCILFIIYSYILNNIYIYSHFPHINDSKIE